MKKVPHILIGLPTMSNIHVLLFAVLMNWHRKAMESGKYSLSIYPSVNVQPVDNARNEIAKHFLDNPEYTHLFFIDSDTIPPPMALDKLIAADKDIISGLTPIIEHDDNYKIEDGRASIYDSGGHFRKWNCVDENDKWVRPFTGIVPIKTFGGSCVLIKREVFAKIKEPFFRFRYEDDSGNKTMISEDVYFAIKALAAGVQSFADTSIICKHNKSILW